MKRRNLHIYGDVCNLWENQGVVMLTGIDRTALKPLAFIEFTLPRFVLLDGDNEAQFAQITYRRSNHGTLLFCAAEGEPAPQASMVIDWITGHLDQLQSSPAEVVFAGDETITAWSRYRHSA